MYTTFIIFIAKKESLVSIFLGYENQINLK